MFDSLTDSLLEWGKKLATALNILPTPQQQGYQPVPTEDPRGTELSKRLTSLRKTVDDHKLKTGGTLGRRFAVVEESIKHGELEGAEQLIHMLDRDIDVLVKQDAHGNVRELANKEDKLVKDAIGKLPAKAKKFQQKKFSKRMSGMLGMEDMNWDSMIGEGASNPFDVISQIGLFKKEVIDPELHVGYLAFQDSLYDSEPPESREKLVKAFKGKKLAALKVNDSLKGTELEQAIKEMEEATPQDKKAAVNKAFGLMGMKGVRRGVEEVRNEIKDRIFLGKDNASINRGRLARKGDYAANSFPSVAVGVLGFASKALRKLQEHPGDKGHGPKLETYVNTLNTRKGEFEEIQRNKVGLANRKKPTEDEMQQKPELREEQNELDEQLKAIVEREKTSFNAIKTVSAEAIDIMKTLDVGLDEKGWETGGGIGSDDEDGKHEAYKTTNKVFMGKNVNVRDEQSAASNIFLELGIPYTGGASGSTADAVGGIVDSLLREDEDPTKALLESDPRKADGEAEICMYIMGMHTAGHHSLVEMIYAAKQYPQKFFQNLHDPISDWIDYQNACSDFMLKYEKLDDDKNPYKTLVEGKYDEKASAAARYKAMTEQIPEKVITHDACIKAFMSHADTVMSSIPEG